MPLISHNFILPDEGEVLVSVDFSKNDEIFSYDFQFKNDNSFHSAFSEFKSRVENKSIKNLIHESWGEKFNVPKVGLFFLFDIYRANKLKISAIEPNLVCRCFNVGSGEIQELIEASQAIGLREILNKTNATGGCGSCVLDIKEMLAAAGKEKVRFSGMTASEVLLEVEKKRLEYEDADAISLLGVQGYYLKINNKKYVEPFGAYLKKSGIDIKLTA